MGNLTKREQLTSRERLAIRELIRKDNERKRKMWLDHCRGVARKAISSFVEHYPLPAQAVNHLEDCIVDAMDTDHKAKAMTVTRPPAR